jgi:hypothetical protein
LCCWLLQRLHLPLAGAPQTVHTLLPKGIGNRGEQQHNVAVNSMFTGLLYSPLHHLQQLVPAQSLTWLVLVLLLLGWVVA